MQIIAERTMVNEEFGGSQDRSDDASWLSLVPKLARDPPTR